MFTSCWDRRLNRRTIFSPRQTRTRGLRHGVRGQSHRLCLEQLEDRCLLSAFAVSAGGLGDDAGKAVATDIDGNVYVAGKVQGSEVDLNAVTHLIHLDCAGGDDALVAKYSPDGVLEWAKCMGGPLDDVASAIAVDHLANVYVTGHFQGTAAFGSTTFTAVGTSAPYGDGFVAKLDTNGNIQWAHQFAGLNYVFPRGIAVDRLGNSYTDGFFGAQVDFDPTASPILFPSPNANTITAPNEHGQSFVAKLDSTGGFVWVRQQSSNLDGINAFAIAVDRSNNVYTTGAFQSDAHFSDGSNPDALTQLTNSNPSNDSVYVLKMTAAGTPLWATPMANTHYSEAFGIAVDNAGTSYTTGYFAGTDVDFDDATIHLPGNEDLLTSAAGSYDVFIAKLDTNGVFAWARNAGGLGDDRGTAVAVDWLGNPYVTGSQTADGFFGNQLVPAGDTGNSFISKLSTDGGFLCAVGSQILTPDADHSFGIAVDHEGFADITGAFATQAQFPPSPPLFPLTSGGGEDIFVYKQKLHCDALAFGPILDQTVDEDAELHSVTIPIAPHASPDEIAQPVTLTAVSSNPDVVRHPAITRTTDSTWTLQYEPVPDAHGMAMIAVTAADPRATDNSYTRIFKITVRATNDAPVAVSDKNYSIAQGNILFAVAPGILANDTDPDGDLLSAVLRHNVLHGQLDLNDDGSFQYTPGANFTGLDFFTYKASDGSLESNEAVVRIQVNPAPTFKSCSGERQSADRVLVRGQLEGIHGINAIGSIEDISSRSMSGEPLRVSIVGLNSSGVHLPGSAAGVTVAEDGSFMGFLDPGSPVGRWDPGTRDPDQVVCQFAGTNSLPAAHSGIGPIVEPPDARALRMLRMASMTTPYVRFEQGVPRTVMVRVPLDAGLPDDPVVRALSYLDRFRDLYGLTDVRSQLFLQRIVRDLTGGVHVFFGERLNNLPIFGAQLAVHMMGNEVTGTGGNYLPDGSIFGIIIDWRQPVDGPAAEAIAVADAGGQTQVTGPAKLMYFDNRLLGGPDTKTHLAWRVGLGGSFAFVDGRTGDVLDRVSLIDEDREIQISDAAGSTEDYPFCGWSFTDLYTTPDGPTDDYQGGDADADAAFALSNQVYDWWLTTFNRDSYNNDGGELELYVHASVGGAVAHFVPDCENFEFDNATVQTDVVAHELTHALTYATANLTNQTSPSGVNEPGALNESYSDIFGEFFEAAKNGSADWLIGETVAPPAPGTGPFRSLMNPPAFFTNVDNDGDTIPETKCAHPDHISKLCVTPDDTGGRHINNGIPNKAAFLIINGGQFNGFDIQGIGIPKAQQLYYYVLANVLGPNTSFEVAAEATIGAAFVFATMNPPFAGFTYQGVHNDLCTVENAFASVGLATQFADQDCDGTPDTVDPDIDGDYKPNGSDNCPTISNNQKNTDLGLLNGDGLGDACDPDDDADGIFDDGDGSGVAGDNPCTGGNFTNCDDNAPLNPNADQKDSNNDGIGDVLEDKDSDGILDDGDNSGVAGDHPCTGPVQTDLSNTVNCDDNAPDDPNPDQKDDDLDGVGDIKDNCPGKNNSDQSDIDEDNLGDACDPDKDGDMVPNEVDDCPENPDPVGGGINVPGQGDLDFDHDMIGIACDPDDQAVLDHLKNIAANFKVFTLPLRISLKLPDPPDQIPADYLTEVAVRLPFEMPARIVDDEGFVVAKSRFGMNKSLRFRPDADFHYMAPSFQQFAAQGMARLARSSAATPGDQLFEGHHYFLEIFPTPEVELNRTYLIGLQVTSAMAEHPHDITPPVFTSLPPDQTVEAIGDGVGIRYSAPGVVDVADPTPMVSCALPSGSRFPVGMTEVVCTATDHTGNSAQDMFHVMVLPDMHGPVVQDLRLATGPTGAVVNQILLTFNEALDPNKAMDLSSFVVATPGRDKKLGTADDVPIMLQSATYLPATMQVRIVTAKPLVANQFYQMTVKGTGPLADLVGNHPDGNADGVQGDDFSASFARGTRLSYADRNGDLVSLAISGGVMELVRGPDGAAEQLRLLDVKPNSSRLTGSVKKPRSGGDGISTLGSITGTGGVQNKLPQCTSTVPTACFQIGSISAMVVDSLLDSREFSRGLLANRLYLGRNR